MSIEQGYDGIAAINKPSQIDCGNEPNVNKRCYKLTDIPEKGEGMVAVRDIPYGQLIIEEPAVLVLPHNTCRMAVTLAEGLPSNILSSRMMWNLIDRINQKSTSTLEETFSTLSHVDQETFMNLKDSHSTDGMKTLLGIWSTNSISTDSGKEGLFFVCSKFNHSCLPNLGHEYVEPNMRMYAARDIKKGEELCYSYLQHPSMFAGLEQRRRKLHQSFGFTCHCELCDMNYIKLAKINIARRKYARIEKEISTTADPYQAWDLIRERFRCQKEGRLLYPELILLHHKDLTLHEIAVNNRKGAKQQAALAYQQAKIVYGENAKKTKLFAKYLNAEIAGIQFISILNQAFVRNINNPVDLYMEYVGI